ncbi:hypothetical protein PoB_002034400 [Plakobranchus ocellatus]|uniref:Uncharacterized protein n=1 Tax=Plakobranchus ocellatus TaxID=259542 RepID=A0AAV3ZEN2_9GAST|nr:hypothetical protein PoB_002034400 [Plakobranchus ocellatus]
MMSRSPTGSLGIKSPTLQINTTFILKVTNADYMDPPLPHTGRTSRQTRRPHCVLGFSIISITGELEWIEVGDSRRRSRQDDSEGRKMGIEDKARWRKGDVAYVPTRGNS